MEKVVQHAEQLRKEEGSASRTTHTSFSYQEQAGQRGSSERSSYQILYYVWQLARSPLCFLQRPGPFCLHMELHHVCTFEAR